MKARINFIVAKDILASSLKVGDMMVITEAGCYTGHVILRTYDALCSLTNPNSTWGVGAPHKGRKLLPGESVTLTQE